MFGNKNILRFLSVIEVFASANLIIRAVCHKLNFQTVLIFAAVTLLFCMSAARTVNENREEQSRKIRENAKLDYDKEKLMEMRIKNIEEDENQYRTRPINPNYYANKILKGEIKLEDVPSTESDYSLQAKKQTENKD